MKRERNKKEKMITNSMAESFLHKFFVGVGVAIGVFFILFGALLLGSTLSTQNALLNLSLIYVPVFFGAGFIGIGVALLFSLSSEL